MIKGIDVTLIIKTKTGVDEFNAPVFSYTEEVIENVLVAPISATDITNNTDLVSISESYQLAIPKGDTHEWRGNQVKFFNKTWEVVGVPIDGIEDLIPLEWNKKVNVVRYE